MDQHTDTENGRGSVAPALVAQAEAKTTGRRPDDAAAERFVCITRAEIRALRSAGTLSWPAAVLLMLRTYDFDGDGKVHPSRLTLRQEFSEPEKLIVDRRITDALAWLEKNEQLRVHHKALKVLGGSCDMYELLPLADAKAPRDCGALESAPTLRRKRPDIAPESAPRSRGGRGEGEKGEEEERAREASERTAGAPSPSSTSRTADPDDPADVRDVLLSWSEWTDERIDGALRETGYEWREVVPDIAQHSIWKPYDNRTNRGSEALELKELVKAVGRARELLSKRAGAGAKPPAAVTAPEERAAPVASEPAHAGDIIMVSPHFAPDDRAAAEVDERDPSAVCDRLGVSRTRWLDVQHVKTIDQFEADILAELEAKPPAIEDDAPADEVVTVSAPALDHDEFSRQLRDTSEAVAARFDSLPLEVRAEADKRLSDLYGGLPAHWTPHHDMRGACRLVGIVRCDVEISGTQPIALMGKSPVSMEAKAGDFTLAVQAEVSAVHTAVEDRGGRHPMLPLVSATAELVAAE